MPRRFGKGKKPPSKKRQRRQEAWSDIVYENADFESYYKTQEIVPESEFQAMMASLRRPLPTTFRINQTIPSAERLRTELTTTWTDSLTKLAEEQAQKIKQSPEGTKEADAENNEDDNAPINPPTAITWYPNQMAWRFSFSRRQFRRIPKLEELHQMVTAETNLGHFLRQEEVSMIPPLLMDIQPHHQILDICAAPGSKTTQLMELLSQAATREKKPITGYVVANDVMFKRCQILVTQTVRLTELTPHLIVTNHDARFFPFSAAKSSDRRQHQYDRVLCDVVCTGDGTMRKAPDVWKTWRASNANSIHRMQVKILERCMRLVKPGGQIVYSTCSLNPIEDEAVVLYCMRSSKHKFELVDASDRLPNLKYAPGKSDWKVQNRNKEWYSSHEELPADEKVKYQPSMFPPADEEWLKNAHVERCMRMVPHYHDTGGFFAAVLRRVDEPEAAPTREKSPTPEQKEDDVELNEDGEVVPQQEGTAKPKPKGIMTSEKLCDYLIPIDATMTKSLESLELRDFPYDRLFRREKGDAKKLMFVSPEIRDLLNAMVSERRWKLVGSGVRALEWWQGGYQGANTTYRFCLEGMAQLRAYLPEYRRISIAKKDVVDMINSQDRKVPFKKLSDTNAVAALQTLQEKGGGGCCLDVTETIDGVPMHVPAHLSANNNILFIFVANTDRANVLYKLGEAPASTPNHWKKKKEKEEQAQQQAKEASDNQEKKRKLDEDAGAMET
eukprot:TRINITY_DN58337_c0_g1_i1.p1 TRINITY_DN58337_c0_g1~~TRINITY_DN58337_c0_g1_i1.p1  ORF type:complete len:728 (+),score=70.25 TRINITY_DN58337_c0_g1_i1:16-2199(+)